jgi:hypothetical protein
MLFVLAQTMMKNTVPIPANSDMKNDLFSKWSAMKENSKVNTTAQA